MSTPFGSVGSWGYALFDDWAQGPVPIYVPGSPMDRASPSTSPVVGDDADDSSTRRFSDDAVRDYNSP